MSRTGRDAVLEAAAAVLGRDPSAPLARVAEAAGIGRATLHRRFPTRADLLRAVALDAVDRAEVAVADARREPGDGLDQLAAAARALLRIAAGLGLVVHAAAAVEAGLQARFDVVQRDLVRLVEQGQRRGEVRPDLPAPWVVEALLGLVVAAADGVRAGTVAPRAAPDLLAATLRPALAPGPA